MMNSTLIKRMQGLWIALVVVLAVGAAGATAASAATPSAQVSALTKKQKQKKKKQLRKCNKQRKAKKRKACKKRVNKKFRKLARKNRNKKGKTYVVDVGKGGNFYVPSLVNIKVNDSVKWDWRFTEGSEAHNVGLVPPFPNGVNMFDIQSQLTSDPTYVFKRKFKKPGNYFFQCSLHVQMTMNVKVKK